MAESYQEYHLQHALRFAQTIFHNIWVKQAFLPKEMPLLENKLENIENAVWVSQLLLRDYFRTFLTFTFFERDFKNDAKIIWLYWLQNRSNDIVKFIDTLAIISEIFLYLYCDKNFNFNSMKAAQWFCEWFQYHFSTTNFLNLLLDFEIQASALYGELFLFIFIKCGCTYQNIFRYDDSIYNQDLVCKLTSSRVMFPVPDRFGNSISSHLFKNFVCIRYEDETENMGTNKIRIKEQYYQEKMKKSLNSALLSKNNNIEIHSNLNEPPCINVHSVIDRDDYDSILYELLKKSSIHPCSRLFVISKRHENRLDFFYRYIDIFYVNNIKFIKFPEQITSNNLSNGNVHFFSDSETGKENTLSPFPFEGTLRILFCEFACYFVGHQC